MRLSTKEIIRYLDMTFDLNQNKSFNDVYFNLWGFLVKVENSAIQSKTTLETQFINFIEPQPSEPFSVFWTPLRVRSLDFLSFAS